MRRLGCSLAAAAVLFLVTLGPAGMAGATRVAESNRGMSFSAQLNSQPLDLSSSGDPIILDPDRDSTLALDLRNHGDGAVTVRQVQIRGTAFGITLLAYDVTINAVVPARSTVKVDVPVEFVDLGQQTDGLLPATIRLISSQRAELAAQSFTVDVRGSPGSLMAIFTMVVAIGSGSSVAAIWIAIGRRRLPPNRFRRGLRLGITGAGIGVTLTLLLAELLLVAPKGSVWIPLLLVPTVSAFVLGFLSPGPPSEEEGEEVVEDWMRATVPTEAAKPVDDAESAEPAS